MLIDKATLSDIPMLTRLLVTLFTQEAEFTPNPQAHQQGLLRIIETPEMGVILVARMDGQIVGMVNLLFTVSSALGASVALLEDMVVSPDARGQGVGKALLSAAINYARSQGCQRITLLTDRDNVNAQNFYAQQGFVESPMIPMRLRLN